MKHTSKLELFSNEESKESVELLIDEKEITVRHLSFENKVFRQQWGRQPRVSLHFS